MGLSIRNQTAEKLARQLSKETGESITQAIVAALEERLERIKGTKRSIDKIHKLKLIAGRCRTLPDKDPRPAEEILGFNDFGVLKNGD